jgi:zona occludens toxin
VSIHLVTGAPGAGKSYWSVRMIRSALDDGKFVATNVPLADGWALRMARSNPFTRVIPGRSKRKAAKYLQRVMISDDLDELFRVRLRGKGEGRGVMVLDEAHKWLNSRTWDTDETGGKLTKGEAVQARLKIVKFFSIHRHIGWDIFLVAQTATNIDTQVRDKAEFFVRLRNLRNFKVAGIRIIPANVFVAIWVWNDPSKSVLKRQSYFLSRGIARLYHTHALAMEGIDDGDVVWLPKVKTAGQPNGVRPDSAEGEAARPRTDPAVLTPMPQLAPTLVPAHLVGIPADAHRLVGDGSEATETNPAGQPTPVHEQRASDAGLTVRPA